jgi:NADH-quinone oxidoreductase subunit M
VQPNAYLQIQTLADFPLLTLICLLPALFAVLVALLPSDQPGTARALGFTGSIITFVVSLGIFGWWDSSLAGYQIVDDFSWIDAIGARWTLGVDGLALPLVLLTTFITPLTFVGSWTAIEKRVKEFTIALLILETGMLGSLLSIDLLVFYVFWEVMLVPMYLIIGIWGGSDRIFATIKFFIYTMAGSLFMLIGIVYLYLKVGGTFSLPQLLDAQLTNNEQFWLFTAFALAFLIKVPVFPFHTWLPDAHTEAPTPGSVILAGVLLKLGTYGLLRFAIPLFPSAMGTYSSLFLVLAVVGIVFGALMAYVQTDVKRLVAYSSVSHLGFVMLGIAIFNEEALAGAVLQMVNHGISTGALFMLVGFIYERRHTREIAAFGGVASKMPVYAGFFVLVTMSSIALPLTNGFVGEFAIFMGTFKEAAQSKLGGPALGLSPATWFAFLGWWRNLTMVCGVIAVSGIILGAIYMLSVVRRVFFGEITKAENQHLRDLTTRERLIMSAMAVLIIVIGVMPEPFFAVSRATVRDMVAANRPAILQVRAPADYKREQQQRLAQLGLAKLGVANAVTANKIVKEADPRP